MMTTIDKGRKRGTRARKTPKKVAFQLNGTSSEPLYQRVESLIREHIEEGRLNEGDRLPSLQQLSDEMGIAYATVARGVRALVESGALEARTGSGTHVTVQRRQTVHRTGILSAFSADQLISKTRYYRALLFMLQEMLVQRGQTVIYNRWDGEAELRKVVANMQPLDGIILFAAPPEHLDKIKTIRHGLPLICLGDMFYDPHVPTVHTTNDEDAARLGKLLWDNGHHYAALLAPQATSHSYTVEQRIKGFQGARAVLGANRDVLLRGTPEEWIEQLLSLRETPSIIVFTDSMGPLPRVFEKLRGTVLEPGRGVEWAIWDENLWHAITPYGIPFWSVEQPLNQIASVAVEELSRMMREPAYQSGLLRYRSEIIRVEADGTRKIQRDAD